MRWVPERGEKVQETEALRALNIKVSISFAGGVKWGWVHSVLLAIISVKQM
jgi:hypothetical protein